MIGHLIFNSTSRIENQIIPKAEGCWVVTKIGYPVFQKIVRRYGCNFKSPLGDLGAVFNSIFRPKPLKGMLNTFVFKNWNARLYSHHYLVRKRKYLSILLRVVKQRSTLFLDNNQYSDNKIVWIATRFLSASCLTIQSWMRFLNFQQVIWFNPSWSE